MEVATWFDKTDLKVSRNRRCRICRLPFMFRTTKSGTTFGFCPQCDCPSPLISVAK